MRRDIEGRRKVLGTTYAELETRRDHESMRKLKRIESRTGMKTGVRFQDDVQYVVSMQAYPKPRFYKQELFANGTYGDPEEVGPSFFQTSSSLKLV